MCCAYDRLKKHRQLKKLAQQSNDEPEVEPRVEQNELNSNLSMDIDVSMGVDIICNMINDPQSSNSSNHDFDGHLDYLSNSSFDYSSTSSNFRSISSLNFSNRSPNCSSLDHNPNVTSTVPTFCEKLQNWAVRHRSNMTIELIEDLLKILRTENCYNNLPKSAAGLLKSKSYIDIKIMKSLKNTNGSYAYFGVGEGLKTIVTDTYTENSIRLLFNIDGLPLYNNSNQQFWPILGLILHDQYELKPFIIAVYSGDSKPQNVNDFLMEFIEEIKTLVLNGLMINQKKFEIEIVGFSCDTPARSFLKQCKGHGGFYACERCETRGKTNNKKRVYPSMNSRLRTKRSFTRQSQKEHHLEFRSLLLDIPDFDPIKSVFLDSMHLLYLGIMKWLLQQWLGTTKKVNRRCRLSRCNIQRLNSNLKVITRFVPKEFQRKKYDLNEWKHWKATQFRFFLLYCGSLVLYDILPKKMYQHFLLLVVACRILNDPKLCISHANYARELLRKFFELLPSFYGSDSQIMNSHNLIHLADDVEHAETNQSAISAFTFENYLGKIKRLIKGRNNSLAQLVRRVSEQKACMETVKKNAINKKQSLIINHEHENEISLKSVTLRGVEFSKSRPNNIVKLDSGEILSISNIREGEQNINFYGFTFKTVSNVFKFPCESSKIGIEKLGQLSRRERIFSLDNIDKKCVLFENESETFTVTLLHDL
ncbi:unnamed protein product [Macrosiphum euphorbiae]|uniref:Transposase domain-containing protein n=1 Tax=Macrosiphum euphorbiae TaxID=13131 RepID=A0AAV0XRI3_9HEMI|nr:unnamed protein product [Macrosiphum euphorbiae]